MQLRKWWRSEGHRQLRWLEQPYGDATSDEWRPDARSSRSFPPASDQPASGAGSSDQASAEPPNPPPPPETSSARSVAAAFDQGMRRALCVLTVLDTARRCASTVAQQPEAGSAPRQPANTGAPSSTRPTGKAQYCRHLLCTPFAFLETDICVCLTSQRSCPVDEIGKNWVNR